MKNSSLIIEFIKYYSTLFINLLPNKDILKKLIDIILRWKVIKMIEI